MWPHERFPTAEHVFNLHGTVAGTVSEFNVSLWHVYCVALTEPLSTRPYTDTDTVGALNNWS